MSTRIIKSQVDNKNILDLFQAISGKLGVDKVGDIWLCGHKIGSAITPSDEWATRQWVLDQGYQNADEVLALIRQSLQGYATEAWVLEQLEAYTTVEQVQSLIDNALLAYYTKTEVDNLLANKQDKLTQDQLDNIDDIPNKANKNDIKNPAITIQQGSNVLGTFTLNQEDPETVLIPEPPVPEPQQQSDWNETDNTQPDFIKNKPTIPAAQVQSNWNETSTSSKAYIQNKPQSLKNPSSLTLQKDGTTATTYDGSSAQTLNIKQTYTAAEVGAQATLSSTTAVTSQAYTRTASSVTATLTKTNLANGATSSEVDAFPMVNTTQAGALSSTDYNQFTGYDARIDALEGTELLIYNFGLSNPSQSKLTDQWKASKGRDPVVKDQIINTYDNTSYIYDGSVWGQIGNSQIGLASSTQDGIVHNSTADGQVSYAAGVGSVNGWSALKASIPAPANNPTITVKQGSTTLGDFSLNQTDAETITIPAAPTVNNGTLTIQQDGVTLGTFKANDSTSPTVNITSPTVNNGILTIQKNGTQVGTFSANASNSPTINITVPTTPADISAQKASTANYQLGGASGSWVTLTKAIITGLGIPGSDTNTTYSLAKATATDVGKVRFSVTPSSGSAYYVEMDVNGWAELVASIPDAPLVQSLTEGNKIVITHDGTDWIIGHATQTQSNSTTTANPGYSGTFTAIDTVSRDTYGHVTGVRTKTVTMPAAQNIPTVGSGSLVIMAGGQKATGGFNANSTEVGTLTIVNASQSQDGAMSSSDKTKLNGIAEGATNTTQPNNATLTIKQGSTTLGTFTADADDDAEITIPTPTAPGNGTLTIKQGSATLATFYANQASNSPVTCTIPTPTAQVQANWNETSTSSKAFILNKPQNLASKSDISNKTITLNLGNQTLAQFTLNQGDDESITIPNMYPLNYEGTSLKQPNSIGFWAGKGFTDYPGTSSEGCLFVQRYRTTTSSLFYSQWVDSNNERWVKYTASSWQRVVEFTDTLKTKLDGIETGAQVNVQSDWKATSGDALILNKPGVVSKSANGLAPQLPNETTVTKYLRQDGTWAVPPNTQNPDYRNNSYNTVTERALTSGNKYIATVGQVADVKASIPTALPNPNVLGISIDGQPAIDYDGSAQETIDIKQTYAVADISGLQTDLNGKQDTLNANDNVLIGPAVNGGSIRTWSPGSYKILGTNSVGTRTAFTWG